MLARVATFAIDGVDPRQVWVEVDIRSGLPAFTIVGLGDAAVRESRERIRSAILNSGFKFPAKRITANLAPAFLRKVGPGFDAALASRACSPPAGRSPPALLPRRRVRRAVARRRAARLAGRARGRRGRAQRRPRAAHRPARARAGGGARRGRRGGRGRDACCGGRRLGGRAAARSAAPARAGRAPPQPEPDLADVRGQRRRCWPWRSPPRAATTCCSRGRRGPARRCSRGDCPRSCLRDDPGRGDRGHSHPQRRRAPRRRTRRHAALPRARTTRSRRRASSGAARRRGPARPHSPTTASCSSTSSPSSSARASRRCASRSRTVSCRSSAVSGRSCFRPGSCWSPPPTHAPAGSRGWGSGACAASPSCEGTGGGSAGRCSTAWTCWSASSARRRPNCTRTRSTDSARARSRVGEARERQRARLTGSRARCNGEMDGRLVRRP